MTHSYNVPPRQVHVIGTMYVIRKMEVYSLVRLTYKMTQVRNILQITRLVYVCEHLFMCVNTCLCLLTLVYVSMFHCSSLVLVECI